LIITHFDKYYFCLADRKYCS